MNNKKYSSVKYDIAVILPEERATLSHTAEPLKGERWKPIKRTKGAYMVSNFGRVKRTKNNRLITPTIQPKGYMYVMLNIDGKAHNLKLHRVVAIEWIPNPHNKPEINHKDGDKTNNKVNNLEWATHSENMLHAFRRGLKTAPNKGTHLTDAQKQNLREKQIEIHRKKRELKIQLEIWQ